MRRAIRFGAVLATIFAALLFAPLALVVTTAFAPSDALGVSSEQWVAGAGAGRAFRYVWETYGGHLVVSLALALGVGLVALLVGAPAGVATALDDRPVARAIDTLLTLPLAVPGISAAIALLMAYPGGVGLIFVGHALYTLPYAVRTISAGARTARLGPSLDAARTLGADPIARARFVFVPVLRRALGSALLVALAVSWGEFNVSFLLATPSRATFPTALYLTYTTNSLPIAAAATALLVLGLVPLVVLALVLGGERGRAPAQEA